VKEWMDKFLLMYEYFRFVYKFYPEDKSTPNSCFLLTSLNTRRGAKFDLQHYNLLLQ